MKACMDENGVCFDDSQILDLAKALFEDAAEAAITDLGNKSSGITLEAFKAQLNKHEGLLQNLSITIDRWLIPTTSRSKTTTTPASPISFAKVRPN